MQNTDYLTVKEICRYLEICPSTLYNWVKSDPNFPKRRKMGYRRNIFLRLEVDSWLASRPARMLNCSLGIAGVPDGGIKGKMVT